MKLPSSSTYALWLALFRIYAGAFWLMHGIPKFLHGEEFMPPNGAMMQFLNQQISCRNYARTYGIDMPEATDWTWPY